MPHVQVETNLWDTEEAVELGRLVGVHDAWKYVVRIWGWGLDANCESGVIHLRPARIAGIVEFEGDPDVLFNALVATKWLVPRASGGFYMRGWSRNRRYFLEKRKTRDRMRKYRERRARDAESDADVTRNERRTFGGDRDPDPDRDRDRDRSIGEERGGQLLEDQLERVDQVTQAVLDAKLGLSMPGESIARRILSILPVPRARVVTAIDATAKADVPNWTYFADCLENPAPPRRAKRSGSSKSEALDRAQAAWAAGGAKPNA